MERRRLTLRHLVHLAEHLAGAGLVEADLRVHDADRIQHAGDAQRRELAGEHGLLEAGGYEALRRQVVDLVRAVLLENVDQADLVEQVALDDLDAILDVSDAVEVDGARAAHHADHLVTAPQQEFGQVRSVLTGDAGDQRL